MLSVIVPRRESSLHDYLTMRFAGVAGIQILLARRQGERRRKDSRFDVNRRRVDVTLVLTAEHSDAVVLASSSSGRLLSHDAARRVLNSENSPRCISRR